MISASRYRARASRPSAPYKEAAQYSIYVASTPPELRRGAFPASIWVEFDYTHMGNAQ